MPIPDSMDDLSATINSNSPAGTETPGNGDDYIRALSAIIRRTNAKGSDIASAATTDIGAATAEFVDVTGTTTITALGTIDSGIERTVRFTGALTLTHNATSLILPGSANITTANGDCAIFRSLGSGNWKCVSYVKQSGIPLINPSTFTSDVTMSGASMLWAKGADVASADALPLITDGNYFDVTGTTTITSMNSMGVGTWIGLQFDGALTLTHNATDLVLPGGANITTAAGDEAIFVEYASGDWRCVSYTRSTALVNPSVLGAYTALSSTSTDIGSIPSWVKKITINFVGMSTNGTSPILIQVGDAGGIETSGYLGSGTSITATSSNSVNSTAGFLISQSTVAGSTWHGHMTLTLADAATNTWVASSVTAKSDDTNNSLGAGSKALSAALDRIRITTVGGANTFDAGNVSIMYE
jgi:hypothetical protein